MQQSDSEDLLCSVPRGLTNLENDDGNHDLRGVDKWLVRSGQ